VLLRPSLIAKTPGQQTLAPDSTFADFAMAKPITLTPSHGWGWSDREGRTRDVPATFAVDAEQATPGSWRGRVVTEGHEFVGATATISQRHVHWDSDVNVQLRSSDTTDRPLATGFARLEAHPEGPDC